MNKRQTAAESRPLRDVARAARRSAVLRQAEAEFRRTGVAAADLSAIARGVGISRAGLYNYCTGREDLARQCYLDALAKLQLALATGRQQPGLGIDKLVAFVRAAMAHDRPIAVIAAELDLLPIDAREEIEREQRAAFDALASLIHAGVADASVRACDPDIAARTIWGLISWTPLGEVWAGRTDDDLGRRMDAELPALIERGIANEPIGNRDDEISSQLLTDILNSRPADRAEEIARTASSLFNRRGIDGVTLDDVAAEMQATKGLIYHHFDSKTALVRHCFERGFEIYGRILSTAEAGVDGLEQSRRGIWLNAQAQLHSLHPMSLNAAYRQLPAGEQARFTSFTTALLDRSIAIANRGSADGSIRQFNAVAVALASAGSFLFLGRWISAGEAIDPAAIAREVSNLFLFGLRARF